ncbi:MAG: hypothetical protein ACYTFG_17835 [Planctomycetota bacterium]|jgi:hypothetical protein
MEWLHHIWGLKTVAFLDAWTFEHFLCGISLGSLVCTHHRKVFQNLYPPAGADALFAEKADNIRTRCNLMLVLLVAFSWETLEHYLETGLAGQVVAHWLQGVEFWGNRLVADPLMLVLGCLTAARFPALVWPARVLTLAWLVLHIFFFPHSMHLHALL